jgi:hypothetical protein
MVKLGYGDSHEPWEKMTRCLDFRVSFNSAATAAEAVLMVGQYNDFDPKSVAEALLAVGEILGGGYGSTYYVGREGSPVIYISSYNDVDWVKVQDALRRAKPDELGMDERGYRPGVRAWWD